MAAMIAGQRVQWVTRRFWPIVSDSVWHTLAMAQALQSQGCAVEIVTAAWHSSWPQKVQLREIDVQRIEPSPTTPFRLRRFTRSLLEYLDKDNNSERSNTECVLMAEANEDESLTLVEHFHKHRPVVVRYDSIDGLGPLSTRLRSRAIEACAKASQIIVPHDYARRELIGAGVQPALIKLDIPVPYCTVDRSSTGRSAARRALADINHELFLRAEDRAIVCLSELTKSAGVEFIIQALGPLIENQRDVRLWIVGDGPERLRLYDLIKRQGWRHDIAMPGTFEDPDMVLAAADLCIVPSPRQGCQWLMQTTLASGLPTLMCAGPSITARLGASAQPLLFEAGNSVKLQKLVARWLENSKCFVDEMAAFRS